MYVEDTVCRGRIEATLDGITRTTGPHSRMAETTVVGSEQEFVQALLTSELVEKNWLDVTDDGARELWRIWADRRDGIENPEDYLVAVPSWFAEDEFGKRHPYLFADIEYDSEDSGAILFGNARHVDVNVVENGIWDDMTMSDTVEIVDQRSEHIDELGKVWIPRSLLMIVELE